MKGSEQGTRSKLSWSQSKPILGSSGAILRGAGLWVPARRIPPPVHRPLAASRQRVCGVRTASGRPYPPQSSLRHPGASPRVPGCASAQPRGKLTSPSGEGSPYHLDPDGAVPAEEGMAQEALRTIPPRETAGNIDIKQIPPGASVLLPAYVPGGLVSIGDAHYAQGAYEASGTAIEMRSRVHLRFGIRKGEVARGGIRDVQFFRDDCFTSPEMAAPRRFFATTGLSVAQDGKNESRGPGPLRQECFAQHDRSPRYKRFHSPAGLRAV